MSYNPANIKIGKRNKDCSKKGIANTKESRTWLNLVFGPVAIYLHGKIRLPIEYDSMDGKGGNMNRTAERVTFFPTMICVHSSHSINVLSSM